jgi:hypothetical protein
MTQGGPSASCDSVNHSADLYACLGRNNTISVLENYNSSDPLYNPKQLADYAITEQQFAQVIGRCRMYQHLPAIMKQEI